MCAEVDLTGVLVTKKCEREHESAMENVKRGFDRFDVLDMEGARAVRWQVFQVPVESLADFGKNPEEKDFLDVSPP